MPLPLFSSLSSLFHPFDFKCLEDERKSACTCLQLMGKGLLLRTLPHLQQHGSPHGQLIRSPRPEHLLLNQSPSERSYWILLLPLCDLISGSVCKSSVINTVTLIPVSPALQEGGPEA